MHHCLSHRLQRRVTGSIGRSGFGALSCLLPVLTLVALSGCGDTEPLAGGTGGAPATSQAGQGSGEAGSAATPGDSSGGRAGSAGAPSGGGNSSGTAGTAAVAGVAGAAGSAAATTHVLLVDDFEDGDDKPRMNPGGWYLYDDNVNGGKSTLAFTGAAAAAVAMNGPGYQSNRSLEVSYSFDQGTLTYNPYIGFGVWLADSKTPLDLTAYTGISYVYRGGAHRVRVETFDVTDYDQFGINVPAASAWTKVDIAFAQLTQEGWGKKVAFNPAHVGNISFQASGSTGASAQLDLDNLAIVSTSGPQKPDMTVRAAESPTDAAITSIAIANPLQEKAMATLSRGYNLTNWLEQDRFAAFTYDETTIANLAKAGYRAVRLPIDLDLYVTAKSGSGTSQDVTLHSDLFAILDAFDAWTTKYGLSLTIDYHQYDHSLLVSDPDSVGLTVVLWSKVAEHFASNPREDLYFELLNEPTLSSSGTPPTQAQWTAIAEQMIAAIRAVDATHTLIFGDVQWYDINSLVTRKPLSDPNVVYAFHDYDPFIFTHQGADWASMASTHDLPYPYDSSRWSAYFVDLGFNQFMDSWILDSARNYYRTGNRSAIRNPIVLAKKWAVSNNVPLICNEFGAYDKTSQLEDRARYYADMISIFEELAVPWQHWFMLMDKSGTVVPEYRAALHLDQ